MLWCFSECVCLCIQDRTSGLILFVLQREQCHIVVLDRFSPQQSDSKPRGCAEPMGRMASWMAREGVLGKVALEGGGGGGGSQQQT